MSPKRLLAAGATLLTVALLLFLYLRTRDALPEGFVRVRGTLAGVAMVAEASVPGRVIALPIAAGGDVAAGRPLAILSSDQLAQRVEEAAAEVDAARTRLAKAGDERDVATRRAADLASKARRIERLAEAGEAGSDEVATAEALRVRADEQAAAAVARVATEEDHVREAAARLERARAGFGETEVTAVAAGTVTRHFVEPGENVRPGTSLVELVDLDRLRFVARVAPAVAARLAPGQSARISFPGADDVSEATIERIGDEALGGLTPSGVGAEGDGVPLRIRLAEDRKRTRAPGSSALAMIRWRDDLSWPDRR